MSVFTRSRAGKVLGGLALVGASALVLAGCAGGGDAAAPSASSGGGAVSKADGTFSVGTILPATGNLAFLGPPEVAGVKLAIKDIEATGDAFPFKTTLTERDSGDTTTDIATQSATELVSAGADVVIGAASSGVSFTFVDQLVNAGIVQISPANTSPDFTTYADDGYYWRTAPSDVLQGRVLGNLMVGDGAANVGIIYINDPYGTGLKDNATKAIEAAGGEVSVAVPYNPGDTVFTSQVDQLLAAKPDAIAVIAFEETSSIIPQLVNTQGFPGSKVYFVDGNLSNSYEFQPGTLQGAKGTLPGNPADTTFQARLKEVDPSLTDFSYAPESYDAVILAALAAAQAKDDSGTAIRDNLQSVSEGGEKCTTFADCLKLINDGKDIDYDGVSGPITFDENGDPTEAYIGIYQYGADNKYTLLNTEFGSLNE
ncbi:MAG: branched-chain amino acid ABC transporter substrate-binding protein [Microbacterium sp. 71-36]|uniref:ABC transporter substrate-binding protein n=1 Tax=unclassified Microbacterium TaxID=2609290 RepID=UPI000869B659|nr:MULTISPECIES: ABC transporter substrate-binding protein [unclassified Microbacterium]MBN9210017.1 ABC transporter substrate-binding protein [Microbacterium sp.]ODT39028.1 MAG: branched-chain amino acid ABC transporter substrate-binding protein [Microbacterium sp. SCN 71-17]OJV74811.1 MAG: branched-chain amino acid ABC transporter substrate-binding protein [Microbacterium sp. 71-36]